MENKDIMYELQKIGSLLKDGLIIDAFHNVNWFIDKLRRLEEDGKQNK